MRKPRRPGAMLLALTLVACAALAGCTGDRPALEAKPDAVRAGASTKVATLDPRAVDLTVVATAVVSSVDVYAAPDAATPTRALSNPLLSGAPLVFLVDRTQGDWLQVLLPTAPEGSTGWIRAGDVMLAQHNYRIDVRPSEFRLDVSLRGEVVRQIVIGVATDNLPRAGGRYYTTELLPAGLAGGGQRTLAYGLSGFSDSLESYNGMAGQFAIHGTDDPATVGQTVFSGCVRMGNADMEDLSRSLPVGIPVYVSE